MSDGEGCICSARSEGECCCPADWTPQEVFDLRIEIADLKKELNKLLMESVIKENLKDQSIADLKKEVTHWKANHDDLKKRLHYYTNRPDITLNKLQKDNERLKKGLVDISFLCADLDLDTSDDLAAYNLCSKIYEEIVPDLLKDKE